MLHTNILNFEFRISHITARPQEYTRTGLLKMIVGVLTTCHTQYT